METKAFSIQITVSKKDFDRVYTSKSLIYEHEDDWLRRVIIRALEDQRIEVTSSSILNENDNCTK